MDLTDLEKFPTSETAQDMLSMVTSGFYENSYVGKWLFQVMGMELEDGIRKMEELRRQIFPDTATWGLVYHEEKYGLHSIGSIEDRRNKIQMRRFSKKQLNPEILKEKLNVLTGISKDRISIRENTAPYTFKVKMIDNGYVVDYKKLQYYLKKIKQSHMHIDINSTQQVSLFLPIHIDGRITCCTQFYPRNNMENLYLDESWGLDGEYALNGYKSNRYIDFYPLRIEFLFGTNKPIAVGQGMECRGRVLQKISHGTQCTSGSQFETGAIVEEVVHILTYTTATTETDGRLITGKDIWYLDGSVRLDGSRVIPVKLDQFDI